VQHFQHICPGKLSGSLKVIRNATVRWRNITTSYKCSIVNFSPNWNRFQDIVIYWPEIVNSFKSNSITGPFLLEFGNGNYVVWENYSDSPIRRQKVEWYEQSFQHNITVWCRDTSEMLNQYRTLHATAWWRAKRFRTEEK